MAEVIQRGQAICKSCGRLVDWRQEYNGVQTNNFYYYEGRWQGYCRGCGAPLHGNVNHVPDVGLPKLRDNGGAFKKCNEEKES